MITHLSSDSWDSDGNRLVSLYGIRIAMGLALLAAIAFLLLEFIGDRQWHEQHPGTGASGVPDPAWMSILWFALPFAPLVLSGLLLSTRSKKSKASGAGVAAGLFACGLLFAIAALLGLFLTFSPNPYFRTMAIANLTFLACTVWTIVSAFRVGTASWALFFLSFVATLIFVAWGNDSLKDAEYKLDRQNEQQKAQAGISAFKPVVDAQHQITSLANCLLLNHSIHPKDGYPFSLDPPPANWPCDTKIAENTVKDYTLRYVPHADSPSGSVTDFHLIAIPVKKGNRYHYPLMVDSRGIVFSDPMWETSSPYIRAATSEGRRSEIEALRSNIERYINNNGLVAAPLTLNAEAIGTTYSFQIPSIEDEDNGRRLRIENYALYYLAPKVGSPSRFALSAQCQSYGRNCLRSYFLDYDGVLHATGEPRQATADDPLALECEESDSACKDVGWPIP
jgi:hypothetical protein